ncbi:MAG: alkane 1-monooxygenase, partial [Bradymonadia bacterium]
MHAFWYLVGFIVPLTVLVSAALGGIYSFLTPVVVFALTPVIDELLPKATDNLDADGSKSALDNAWYDVIVRAWVPVQLGTMVYALWRLTTADFQWYEMAGVILSTGILGGTGINVAHELMHRKGKLDRALAELLTWFVTYTHFCVEHVYGHHKQVATPNDPATAQYGETVYAFLPKSLLGGVKSFWHIETNLIARRKTTTAWYHDRRIRYTLELLLSYGAVAYFTGWAGVLMWAAFGLIASVMLEVINYLEHYGLERKEVKAGKYERVQPHHSWSSSHRLTGLLLFGL